MDREELAKSYLARLGLDAEPPTAAALVRLHRAHVERVPWETLWIHCGETWGTDPVVVAQVTPVFGNVRRAPDRSCGSRRFA